MSSYSNKPGGGGGFVPGSAKRIPYGNAGGTALTDVATFAFDPALGSLGINTAPLGNAIDIKPLGGAGGSAIVRMLSVMSGSDLIGFSAANQNHTGYDIHAYAHNAAGTHALGMANAGLTVFTDTAGTNTNVSGMALGLQKAAPVWLCSGSAMRFRVNASGGLKNLTGLATAVREIADAAVTVTVADSAIIFTSQTAARVVTLPALAAVDDGFLVIVAGCSATSGANTITVDGSGAETVNGAANVVINTAYGVARVMKIAGEWRVV